MGQAPFLEHSSGHGESRADQFASLAGRGIVEQPFLECVRLRVVFDRLSQQIPLDRKPEGVGCLIPFAFSPASFRRFERREERFANIGRPKRAR